MDINNQLQPVIDSMIENLKASIEDDIRQKISDEVLKKIANSQIHQEVEKLVKKHLEDRVSKFDFVNASHEQLTAIVAALTDRINSTMVAEANKQINSFITQKLAAIDLTDLIGGFVNNKINSMLTDTAFPPQSISHRSINFTGLSLSGDHIKGGIIDQFGSAGIEDRATHVQMTLMDHATAFEGPLWAPEAKIMGNLTVNGLISINGDIDTTAEGYERFVKRTGTALVESLDNELFDKFSTIIFNKIKEEGLDLDKITQAGKEVVKGNQIGYHVVDSNLQRVGMLRDLQTQGEALLCQTLYATDGRVGVNTLEPSAVLSVWDEEVEITVAKRTKDTGYISTPRFQSLILGANGKENITLTPDGNVSVDKISIKNISMSSAPSIPNYEGTKGQIIWNENPGPGSAIGWVCLGGHFWAKFGTIE